VTDVEAELLTARIAATVAAARGDARLSAAELAARSGVSRAMIGKVERGEAQPTAALLGRLAAALGLTLSALIARAEDEVPRLLRAGSQPVWTDPETGYHRRAVSPPGAPLELTEVELPPYSEVPFDAAACGPGEQQLWVLEGWLRLAEGDNPADRHDLATGDCLRLGPPAARTYANPHAVPCRYLIARTTQLTG
jgi:transcriptional regulator with XRE-family HTH domain